MKRIFPNSLKTHCPQGHVYDKQNTRYYDNGRTRHCAICIKIRNKKNYTPVGRRVIGILAKDQEDFWAYAYAITHGKKHTLFKESSKFWTSNSVEYRYIVDSKSVKGLKKLYRVRATNGFRERPDSEDVLRACRFQMAKNIAAERI